MVKRKRHQAAEEEEPVEEQEGEDQGEWDDEGEGLTSRDAGDGASAPSDGEDDGFVKRKDKWKSSKELEKEAEEVDEESFIKSIKAKKSSSGGFQTMGLSKSLLNAIAKKGYKVPTPIQRKCIPLIMDGHDVVGMARTGSGKTAAFLVPLIEKLKSHSPKPGARGIVLSPSRELALQTLKFAKELCKFTDLRCALLVGGDSLEDQFVQMTSNPDIVIGTPGRFLHLVVEMDLSLKSVEYIVFDEADRLFESGFAAQLHEIMSKLPDFRQTILFSATLPKLLVEFAKAGLRDPTLVRLDTDVKISAELEMAFLSMNKDEKIPFLLFLLREVVKPEHLSIIFVATKHHVEYLHQILTQAGIDSTTIYGALDQTARKINLAKFRNGKTKILIVTDVASRGIDIPLLENVINFDFPPTPKLFVHRVGRAARAGRPGFAYSLVSQEEVPYLIDLQLFLGRPLITAFKKDEDLDLKATVSLGSVPRNVLNDPTEELIRLHSNFVEISNLKGVVANAVKLYNKTRPLASSQSYVRAKEIQEIGLDVHPILKPFVTDNEIKVQEFLLNIKNYKPHETIFEATNTSKKEIAIMKEKRELDAKKIKQKPALSKAAQHQEPESVVKIENADESLVEESFSSILGRKPLKPKMEVEVKSPPKSNRDEEYYIHYQQADQNTEKGYAMKEGTFFEQARSAEVDFTGDDNETMKKQKNVLIWDRKKKRFVRSNNATKDVTGQVKTESGKKIHGSYKTSAYEEWKTKNKITSTNADQPLQMVRRYDGRWVPKRNNVEEKNSRSRDDDDDHGGDDNEGPARKKQKLAKGSFIGTQGSSGQQSGGKGKGKGGNGGGNQKDQRKRDGKKRPEMGTVTKGKKGMRREIKSAEQIRKQRKIAEFRQKRAAKGRRLGKTKGKGKGRS